MNELSQIQMVGISIGFSFLFLILLYIAHRVFKAELKGDWGIVVAAAFPFLAYAAMNLLSTDVLKKEIQLSVGFVNVKLPKEDPTTVRPEFLTDRQVNANTEGIGKLGSGDIKEVIERARRNKSITLLVDANKYIPYLPTVDKYANNGGHLFKHVVFIEGGRFLGYATPQDIDWYIRVSGKYDKAGDFYTHLREMQVQTDVIYTTTSEAEALAIMQKLEIETIAVLNASTRNYKGLVSRQQIAESMLSQLSERVGKTKTSNTKPTVDEYAAILKSIRVEIQNLSKLQSQQLGLLQGSLPRTSDWRMEDVDLRSRDKPPRQNQSQQPTH